MLVARAVGVKWGGEIHHLEWRELLELVKDRGGCDTLVVDAPYSAITHDGHNAGARMATKKTKGGKRDTGRARRAIAYSCWTPGDVATFVADWHPWVRGWIVSLTDDYLAPHWRIAMTVAGRKAFAPLPAVEWGGTVRRRGDGPSSWTSWVCVGRHRSKAAASWGTTPGAYVSQREAKPEIGGKTIELMRSIVRDYSRPGDLVVDPCCGKGGTTIAAALLEGRIGLGGDVRLEAAEAAAKRIEWAADEARRAEDAARPVPAIPSRDGTLPLFGELLEPSGPRLVASGGKRVAR